MAAMEDLILVGVITGAHGIRGEVKLRSFTANPKAIADYNPLANASGRAIEILGLREQKDGFIASLRGVTDRNAAETLKGVELFVPRSRLPEPAPGEVYQHDLIGMGVVLTDGRRLGEVTAIANYGAGDLLDVRVEGKADSVLIPFSPRFLTFEGKTIVADLPEGYLDESDRH